MINVASAQSDQNSVRSHSFSYYCSGTPLSGPSSSSSSSSFPLPSTTTSAQDIKFKTVPIEEIQENENLGSLCSVIRTAQITENDLRIGHKKNVYLFDHFSDELCASELYPNNFVQFLFPQLPEFKGEFSKVLKVDRKLPLLELLKVILSPLNLPNIENYEIITLDGLKLTQFLAYYGLGCLFINWELKIVQKENDDHGKQLKQAEKLYSVLFISEKVLYQAFLPSSHSIKQTIKFITNKFPDLREYSPVNLSLLPGGPILNLTCTLKDYGLGVKTQKFELLLNLSFPQSIEIMSLKKEIERLQIELIIERRRVLELREENAIIPGLMSENQKLRSLLAADDNNIFNNPYQTNNNNKAVTKVATKDLLDYNTLCQEFNTTPETTTPQERAKPDTSFCTSSGRAQPDVRTTSLTSSGRARPEIRTTSLSTSGRAQPEIRTTSLSTSGRAQPEIRTTSLSTSGRANIRTNTVEEMLTPPEKTEDRSSPAFLNSLNEARSGLKSITGEHCVQKPKEKVESMTDKLRVAHEMMWGNEEDTKIEDNQEDEYNWD